MIGFNMSFIIGFIFIVLFIIGESTGHHGDGGVKTYRRKSRTLSSRR